MTLAASEDPAAVQNGNATPASLGGTKKPFARPAKVTTRFVNEYRILMAVPLSSISAMSILQHQAVFVWMDLNVSIWLIIAGPLPAHWEWPSQHAPFHQSPNIEPKILGCCSLAVPSMAAA
jgi:hypothetical protein